MVAFGAMMLVLARDTIRNPDVLDVRQLPRRFFGRVVVVPRAMGPGLALRILAELQLVRYGLALLPLVVVALVWRGAALPLSQAPLLMLIIIWWVEMRLLRPSPRRRARMIDAAEADRGLDLLRVRGREALARIAAGRGLRAGRLRLVVEQSELGALPPLTYVTVQSEDGPRVLDLDEGERAAVSGDLFRAPLDERRLLRINQAQDTFLREVVLDARGVSAHARLAAALA